MQCPQNPPAQESTCTGPSEVCHWTSEWFRGELGESFVVRWDQNRAIWHQLISACLEEEEFCLWPQEHHPHRQTRGWKHYGHVHTAVEYGCQSCFWVLNTVMFTNSMVIYIATGFYNRTHTRTFSGLTTAFSEHMHCVEWNRTGQLVVCHVIQCEREPLCHTNAHLPCVLYFHVFSVTYSDREMSCVSSESFRSSQFSTEAAPVSFVFCVRLKISALHPNAKAAVS